eukprot:gene9566-11332_t
MAYQLRALNPIFTVQRSNLDTSRKNLKVQARESQSEAYARIRESRARAKAERERAEKGGRGGGLGGILGALDFQEDIEADRGLLAKAKRLRKGDKMSRDQYNALQRKVGGTKDGFFGETVDVKGKYSEKGYTTGSDTASTSMGSIVGAILALGGVVATLVALQVASL